MSDPWSKEEREVVLVYAKDRQAHGDASPYFTYHPILALLAERDALAARVERYEALLRKQRRECAVQIETDGACAFCEEIDAALRADDEAAGR